MQVTETSAEGLKHELTITIAAADIERRVTERLNEIGRSVRIPGFRPGKVPMSLLRQRYGRSVMGEVLESAVSDSSAEAMRERKLRPALQPKVEIVAFDEGASLEYKMAVEVLPEIEPVAFADIALERLKPEVPAEDIDRALERIARQQRKSETVERPAEKGDVVIIDFAGARPDGAPIPAAAANGYSLELGSNSFIPGFEDGLIGARAGEERTLDLAFPADFGNEELAGQPVRFAVTVKEVRGMAAQPVDDSLATAVGMENLEDLRKAVAERISQDYGRIARQKLKRDLLDRLAERYHFPVPQGMVDIEFDSIWKQVEEARKRRAGADGAAAADAKPEGEAVGSPPAEDDETVKAEYRAIAERRVRLGLLLAEVGRANAVSVTQEEVNRALLEEARRYPGQERQVIEHYRAHPQLLDGIRAPLYEDKVVDFIVERAAVTDRAVAPAELMAAAAESDDTEDKPAPAAAADSAETPSA